MTGVRRRCGPRRSKGWKQSLGVLHSDETSVYQSLNGPNTPGRRLEKQREIGPAGKGRRKESGVLPSQNCCSLSNEASDSISHSSIVVVGRVETLHSSRLAPVSELAGEEGSGERKRGMTMMTKEAVASWRPSRKRRAGNCQPAEGLKITLTLTSPEPRPQGCMTLVCSK